MKKEWYNNEKNYTKIKISKKNGKFRNITIPNRKLKLKLNHYKKRLNNTLNYFEELIGLNKNIIQGFRFCKSPVTNAEQHIGFKHTISMDLENFFDTVTIDMVSDYFNERHLRETYHEVQYLNRWEWDMPIYKLSIYCFVDNILPQGFSTSPTLSNLAFLKTDKRIDDYLNENLKEYSYTRYADDITISFNSELDIQTIISNIQTIIIEDKFIINHKKTKIQHSKGGNRIITGVAVNDIEINPTRKSKRKLRAAIHQNNRYSGIGLQEWNKLNKPKNKNIEIKYLVKRDYTTKEVIKSDEIGVKI